MRWYDDRERLEAEVARVRAQGPSPLLRDRWVLIRCDYETDGVWTRAREPSRAEALPIGLDLMERLHRWTDLFETNPEWDRYGNRWAPQHDRLWSDEGLAIAIAIKRELPGWTVIYHDAWREASADHPPVEERRAFFEYEVTDTVVRTGRRPFGKPQGGEDRAVRH